MGVSNDRVIHSSQNLPRTYYSAEPPEAKSVDLVKKFYILKKKKNTEDLSLFVSALMAAVI